MRGHHFRSLVVALASIFTVGACSEQSPVAPDSASGGVRFAAQAATGSYELTFHTTRNYQIGEGVSRAPVGTEMGVRANVRGSDGTLATTGSVTFDRCELNGNPAPSAACASGSGRWKRIMSVQMDPSGYPPTVYGGRCSSPTVIGFRFRYSGRNNGIASGMSAARDFTWYAE